MTEDENKFAIERFERPSACPVCQGEMKPMIGAEGKIVLHRVQVGSAKKVVFAPMSMLLAYKLCATCCYQQAFNVTAMGLDR